MTWQEICIIIGFIIIVLKVIFSDIDIEKEYGKFKEVSSGHGQ